MKKINLIVLFFLICICHNLKSQIVYQEVGDLKMLSGQTQLLVKYDYSSMVLPDETTEKAFLEKMKKELNEKNAGRGDAFVEKWHAGKKDKWEVKFEELFNKYSSKINISQSNTNAKYTLIVKTVVVFPGQFSSAGLGAVPAWISCEFLIVETEMPDVILSKSTIKHVQGAAFCGDDCGICIQEAYSKIAKSYTSHIKKSKK